MIGKYPLVALIGEGGQAMVYRAVHPELGRDVVIKIARRASAGASPDQDRLLEEGRILAEVEHPNLARVYDVGTDRGRPFLVMEYVPGRTLEQYARQERPSAAASAALVARTARALAAVHAKGVFHIDLKPKNILIDETGRPRLIDFGLARRRHAWAEADETDGLSGTLAYMAPEQARGEGERVGAASDIFSLGGVLYFLLTGRPLFSGDGFHEVLDHARHCIFDRAALDALRVPRRLAAICLRALSAEPADRHARAVELADDLERFGRRAVPLAWSVAAAAVLLAALTGLTAFWRFGVPAGPTASPNPPNAAGPTRGADAKISPTLHVRVWDGERYVDLKGAAPVRTGDQLQVLLDAPADCHVSLFVFTSDGQLQLLATRPPEPDATELRYPADEDHAAPLKGPPGMECLLACGRRAGPVSRDEIQAICSEAGRWPGLYGSTLIRMVPEKVVVEQRDRGFGPAVERPDPEAAVRKRLEALLPKLRERLDYFEGLAFAHEE